MNGLSNLHDMVLFVEVARTRSFSAAGKNLGVPGPTLSRRIAAMETRFGVRLFERSTRRVELTTAGQRYFDRCGHLADEVKLAEEALLDSTQQIAGHLRISMPVDLGLHLIGPALHDFAIRYPAITFSFDLSSSHRDLSEGKVDVAFRLGVVKEDQLIARKLGSVRRALFASPAYLKSHGHPLLPGDLSLHQCIGVPDAAAALAWKLSNGSTSIDVPCSGRFATNNVGMMRVLAERGAGIAALNPALIAEALNNGALVAVLPTWVLPGFPLYAVTTSRMQPTRVKLMLDFMGTRLKFDA